jgi:hypothetical protein
LSLRLGVWAFPLRVLPFRIHYSQVSRDLGTNPYSRPRISGRKRTNRGKSPPPTETGFLFGRQPPKSREESSAICYIQVPLHISYTYIFLLDYIYVLVFEICLRVSKGQSQTFLCRVFFFFKKNKCIRDVSLASRGAHTLARVPPAVGSAGGADQNFLGACLHIFGVKRPESDGRGRLRRSLICDLGSAPVVNS